MLLAGKGKLEDFIVRGLSSQPLLSADDLYKSLLKEKHQFTVQALYKELRKLQAQGVVVKAKGKYSLKLIWVQTLIHFADLLHDTYVDNQSADALIPEGKTRVSWKFSDILKMDDYYMQLHMKLLNTSKSKRIYSWMEHPWYLLFHIDKENQYQDVMKAEGGVQYMVIENDTPLDRALMSSYDNSVSRNSFADFPYKMGNANFVTVCDDFIVSEHLHKDITTSIHNYFLSTPSLKKLDYGKMRALLNIPGKSLIVLERKAVKAQKLRVKFEEFFGS